jgi:hypothetical protein
MTVFGDVSTMGGRSTRTGAIVAGLFTWLAARTGAGAAERTARATRDRERRLAMEEREQAREERAYLHLLEVLNSATEVLETDATSQPAPDYDAVESAIKTVWAEMDAFGSQTVHALFDAFRADWLLFRVDVHNARVTEQAGGSAHAAALEEIRRSRSEGLEAARAIRIRVAAELRGESSEPEDA